jgi:hypothetical protein
MHMGMQTEFLIPRVKHAEETNFRAEVSGIPRDLKKCLGAGVEHQAIDELFVL